MRTLLLPFIPILLAAAGLFRNTAAADARILEVENIVQTSAGGSGAWAAAAKDQSVVVKDRIRTRQRSRATIRLTDLYTMRMEQFTTVELTPALVSGQQAHLNLSGGAAFIFSREKDAEIGIKTPAANGALRGTQILVRISEGGGTFFQVMEGAVEMSNPQGSLLLKAGEAGDAAPGRAPRRTAVLEAKNILQWALYYPAVLDPGNLGLNSAEERAFAASLSAYRAGDLLGALETFPADAPSVSPATKLYTSGVLLAVGRVDECRKNLAGVPADLPGRRALERLIAAVQFRPQPEWPSGGNWTAAEALAESYYQQSISRLEAARDAARQATETAPENGFAWTRLAELEFSFGRSDAARKALRRGLELTPRNAQAHALMGFVLSAGNQIKAARSSFEEAVRLDGALGNGWLGLGLTKIRSGDETSGRLDLQTATTVEPLASGFHSYLGKAFSAAGSRVEAEKDLGLAKLLDPRDPTPWLYNALEEGLNNRLNSAIGELEESIRLNDNRRVYRSGLLLDQDRAVRSANLAKLYQNAGLTDVAVREAARAVDSDYTNASAHLFLANAFDALRDPRRIELRYETPWFNELLLANLLSPVGGGPLSQFVSQQEYSKLLEADGLGGNITHEWRNTEEIHRSQLRSAASVFGNYGNFSFGLDTAWLEDDGGTRPNADSALQEVYVQMKWQATRHDMFYFLGKWQNQRAGDNFETYDDQPLSPALRFDEKQEPGLLLGAWNHTWAPGIHTLALGGRLSARQRLSDPLSRQSLVRRDTLAFNPGFVSTTPEGFEQYTSPALRNAQTRAWGREALGLPPDGTAPASVDPTDFETLSWSPSFLREIRDYLGTGEVLEVSNAPFSLDTEREFKFYTGELQQIIGTEHNTLLAGGRWQSGSIETTDMLSAARPNFYGGFPTPAAEQKVKTDFRRMEAYLYDYLKPTRWLTLIGGVSWDRLEHPDNFRNPPVNSLQREEERVSGKAGFTFSPSRWFSLRGAYTEGMGGVTFDESVRLEPVQVAGFNQAYRTIISESLAGSVEAPLFQTVGLSLDGQLPTRTWWSAGISAIEQDVDRTVGVFNGYDLTLLPISPAYFPGSTRQNLDYEEETFGATLHQLLGDQFSVGAAYRVTRSELRSRFPEFPTALVPKADLTDEATLHQLGLSLNWNSPTGLFARVEANCFSQDLQDDPARLEPGAAPREGDDFWQYNAMVGWRFRRNQGEISAGLLNIGNKNYHLSPLNSRQEIERAQTLVLRCRLSF